MKIVEIPTFSPNELKAYDPHPLSRKRVHRDTLQRISNAFTGPEFVIDLMRLNPGVTWPGASVPDTYMMPVPSPSIGRDTFGSGQCAIKD